MTVDGQEAFERLDAFFEENLTFLNAPGLIYALTNPRKLLREGGFGFANRDSKTPVLRDTLFQIGSISKAFASLLILRCHERGLLDIHAPATNPRRRRKRMILQGEVPNPIDLPSGCRFHPRCPIAVDSCEHTDPAYVFINPNHKAACSQLE